MLLYTSIMPPVKSTFDVNFDDFLFDAQEQSLFYQDPFKTTPVLTTGDPIGYIEDSLEE